MPGETVVIRLPGPHALRVLARSVLFAVALLFLPWLRAAAAQAELLLRDLSRGGLLAPGARAVVFGSDGNCDAPALKQDQDRVLRPASLRRVMMFGDSSVDFLLDFGYFDEDGDRFAFADRVLKHGGILALPIDTLNAFSLPRNYCVIYARRFPEAFVAVQKIAPAGDNGDAGARMDDSSLASLKEGVVSSEPPETTSPELKNMGRKLNRRVSLQMPHQDHSQS